MADVFISYHVKSASKIVEEIVTALEAREIGTGSARRNISCWYSGRDMPSGADFSHIVPSEIEKCNIFLVVMDWGALGSGHVERECAIANDWFIDHNANFKIMPYRVEDCNSKKGVGYYLLNIQRIDGIPHTSESLKKLADEVVSALEAMEKTRREQEEEEKLSRILLKEIQALKEEIQTLRQKIQALQDQNQTLQEEKRTLLHENSTLQEKNCALQEECQKLREQLSWRRHETPEAKIPEHSVSEIPKPQSVLPNVAPITRYNTASHSLEKASQDKKTPKDDLDILAGISEAEQKRRDKIRTDYEQASKRAYDRVRKEAERTEEDAPLHVSVLAVGAIIGRGHHGDVCKAELAGSKALVTLKVDNRNLLKDYPRVWEKVKALREIRNDHIQRFIDFVPDWEKNRSYMILEYIPGETLQKLLYDRMCNGDAPFPQGRVLNWTFQILDALQYLNTHGLLHGDINLSNIMLRPNNVNREDDICLIDFNWTAPGLEAGETLREIQSPDAPEEMFFKVENKEAFRRGIRRDIYHVGMVMYYLLTGEAPNLDKGWAQLVQEEKATVIYEKRWNLQAHGVTNDVEEVILKAISVDPAERYSSAKRMQDALTKLPLTNRETDKKSNHRKISALSRLCAVLGVLLILLGVYQLGAENGVKPEMSAQNETQVSDEALLPSILGGDR